MGEVLRGFVCSHVPPRASASPLEEHAQARPLDPRGGKELAELEAQPPKSICRTAVRNRATLLSTPNII